jgi:hypothetical protein
LSLSNRCREIYHTSQSLDLASGSLQQTLELSVRVLAEPPSNMRENEVLSPHAGTAHARHARSKISGYYWQVALRTIDPAVERHKTLCPSSVAVHSNNRQASIIVQSRCGDRGYQIRVAVIDSIRRVAPLRGSPKNATWKAWKVDTAGRGGGVELVENGNRTLLRLRSQ